MSPVMPAMPVEAFLTPDVLPGVPAGFARSRQTLTRGVPFEWALDSELSLVLLVPTGFATVWRDADPAMVVSASAQEVRPHASPRGADPQENPPARLLVRRARATVATIPLAAGVSRVAPDGDQARTIVDLLLVAWLLHAGTVRGPGDYGSFVEIAWRRVGNGANAFVLEQIDPNVAARTANLAQSTIGTPDVTINPRGGYLP